MKKIVINWLKRNRIHIFAWVFYMLYETVLIGLLYNIFGHPLTYIAHYIVILALFYVNALVMLPWAMQQKKNAIWKVPLILSVQAVVFTLANYFIDILLFKYEIMTHVAAIKLDNNFILRALYRFVLFIGFSTGYFYLMTYLKEKKKTVELEFNNMLNKQRMEKELVIAQNAYLKAQINPHFLFNTLDYVYHNIYNLSPNAAEAILTLSDMMRYAIDSNKDGEYIELGDEIEQVSHLLYLYQLRNNNQLLINFDYSKEVTLVKVIPLVLLTLVENIFKHGDLVTPEHGALIRIHHNNNMLFIETDNLINTRKALHSNNSGLKNIEQRLKHIYNTAVSFKYGSDDNNHFKVELALPLQKAISSNSSKGKPANKALAY